MEVAATLFQQEAAVLGEGELPNVHADIVIHQHEIFGVEGDVGYFKERVVDVGLTRGLIYHPLVIVDINKPSASDIYFVGSQLERSAGGVIVFEHFGPNRHIVVVFPLIDSQHHVHIFELHISQSEMHGGEAEVAKPELHGAGIDHVLVVVVFDGHLVRHNLQSGGDTNVFDGYFRSPRLAQGFRNFVNDKGLY